MTSDPNNKNELFPVLLRDQPKHRVRDESFYDVGYDGLGCRTTDGAVIDWYGRIS